MKLKEDEILTICSYKNLNQIYQIILNIKNYPKDIFELKDNDSVNFLETTEYGSILLTRGIEINEHASEFHLNLFNKENEDNLDIYVYSNQEKENTEIKGEINNRFIYIEEENKNNICQLLIEAESLQGDKEYQNLHLNFCLQQSTIDDENKITSIENILKQYETIFDEYIHQIKKQTINNSIK